jgi:PAS domain-containing protein
MIAKVSKYTKSDNAANCSKTISAMSNKFRRQLDMHEVEPTRSEFDCFFDYASDAIRIINNDFTIRRINRAFAVMTGVNQSEVIGKKC